MASIATFNHQRLLADDSPFVGPGVGGTSLSGHMGIHWPRRRAGTVQPLKEKDRKSLPFRKGRKNPKDLICSKIFEGLLGIVKHL